MKQLSIRSTFRYVNVTLGCALVLGAGTSCENQFEPEPFAVVAITTKTSGGDMDPGYQILFGSERRTLLSNGTLYLRVDAGSQTLTLDDVADNCVVEGPTAVTVKIANADTAAVTFNVNCFATGFEITTHTSGSDTPKDYKLTVSTRGQMSMPINGTIQVTRLPPGAYTLALNSPIATCTVGGPGEVTLNVNPRAITYVDFNIGCVPPVRLEKIAYEVDSVTGSSYVSRIALINPDGSDETRLASGSLPSWSPDGKRFAYSGKSCGFDSYYGEEFCENSLSVMDPETGNEVVLTSASGAITSAWAPTGDVIVFLSGNSGALRLIAPSGGPALTVPLPAGVKASDPSWSPDGQRILFGCSIDNGFSQLCIVAKDGSGFVRLTSDDDPATNPAWSQDGSTIAYTRVLSSKIEVRVMPAEGGGSVGVAEGIDPSWTRDGRLLFARSDGLASINPDGTNLQRLTTGNHRAPAWRPME